MHSPLPVQGGTADLLRVVAAKMGSSWRERWPVVEGFVMAGRCIEMDTRYFRLGFGATPRDIEWSLVS